MSIIRKNNEEKCCGECCWFYGEDTNGYGICTFRFAELQECSQKCEVPLKFVSKKEMRHHMAVLLQANRYRRDDNVPSIYTMPNPKELCEAIDFSVEYIRVFSNL